MSAIRFRYVGCGFIGIGAALAAIACGSSDASAPPGGGVGGAGASAAGGTGGALVGAGGAGGGIGAGGVGGVVGVGGALGGAGGFGGAGGVGAGGVSVGGSTSTTSIKIVGSVTACSGAPAPTAATVAACAENGCTAAYCVPKAQLAAGTDTSLLATCPDGSFCTPGDYIATSGKFLPKTCKSLLGAEGRCISKCVPQVNTQLTTLPKDVCTDSELCAPCFNPIDAADTRACNQGCDPGPVNKTPVTFTPCGTNLGVCVPPTLVTSPTQQSALKAIDNPEGKCTQTDASGTYLCAPVDKARNQAFKFPPCASTSLGYTLATALPNGQKAACVPYYLIPTGKAGLVDAGDCKQPAGAPAGKGYICAPCTDPTAGNASTGACD